MGGEAEGGAGTPRKQERTQLDIKDTEQLRSPCGKRASTSPLGAWKGQVSGLMNEINEHESTMYRTDGNYLLRSLEYVAVEMHTTIASLLRHTKRSMAECVNVSRCSVRRCMPARLGR